MGYHMILVDNGERNMVISIYPLERLSRPARDTETAGKIGGFTN
jgi:hypothetical protein